MDSVHAHHSLARGAVRQGNLANSESGDNLDLADIIFFAAGTSAPLIY
jgi:hypothetical protein